jgi:predicted Rossmann fold flavoprotein
MMKKELIVIGGGAAGIFCAVNAARLNPELRITVLEKTGKLLSKVRISGGGRCNVTHACYDIQEMAGKYPRGGHFVRKALYRWFTKDTVGWFQQRGVELKTEADGRMFPVSDSSQTIIDCLMKELNLFGVEVRMHAQVGEVEIKLQAASYKLQVGEEELRAASCEFRADNGDQKKSIDRKKRFLVRLTDGRVLEADYVCIACGGYPNSALFEWIRKLGHTIEEPVPSLFTFNMPKHPITELMGVSVPEVVVKISGTKLVERGPLLITHWGMSGPVILRLSAWGARELATRSFRFQILVNWIPSFDEAGARRLLQEYRTEWAGQKTGKRCPFSLPQRLWEWLLGDAGINGATRWADLPAKDQNKLVNRLCACELPVAGKTTFKEEFVTAGGVRLAEVDPSTMQSRKVAGLFFAGEILDVDGITGGFNFQHAWTSGWIAADSVAKEGCQR